MGCIAMLLLDNFGEAGRSAHARVNATVLPAIFPWRRPLREVSAMLDVATDDALAYGETDWATYVCRRRSCDALFRLAFSAARSHLLVACLLCDAFVISVSYMLFNHSFLLVFCNFPCSVILARSKAMAQASANRKRTLPMFEIW